MAEDIGTDALPDGLSFCRKGQAIETVASKAAEVRLLFSRRGIELVEASVKTGERITLVPPAEGEALEAYYILQGVLRCDLATGALRVGAGDYLIADHLKEPVIFEAEKRVRFLYFTSQPSFRYISNTLRELMQLAVEVEQKDGYTADHCDRMTSLCYKTGNRLGLLHDRLHVLEYAAYLHDAGKIKIPLEILNKPGALSPAEWEVVKKHPIYGREMVEETFMKDAGPIIEQHHEHLDGSGYPYGLAGDEILIEAFIVAVVDAFDAMTSHRPYRPALSVEQAFEEIKKGIGRLYPANVVEAFLVVIQEESEFNSD